MNNEKVKVPVFCRIIDGGLTKLGGAVSWLNTVLVINIVVQVILRYAFGEGKIWLEELQWHLYGGCIMIGLSYCLVENVHVRLDLFHQKFSTLKKAIIEFSGLILFVLPLFIILFFHGIDFFQQAWHLNESSPSPMGLPCRWIIKSVIPISMLLVIFAALSRAVRSLAVIYQTLKNKG